jgi:hypothetical protein
MKIVTWKCDGCGASLDDPPKSATLDLGYLSATAELCEPCHKEIHDLVQARTGANRVVVAIKKFLHDKVNRRV